MSSVPFTPAVNADTLILPCGSGGATYSVLMPTGVAVDGRECSCSLVLDKRVKIIFQHAFSSSKLTSVTIPNSVTSIGTQAFAFNSSLTTISIPKALVILGSNVFERDSSLTKINYCGALTEFPITPTCTSK